MAPGLGARRAQPDKAQALATVLLAPACLSAGTALVPGDVWCRRTGPQAGREARSGRCGPVAPIADRRGESPAPALAASVAASIAAACPGACRREAAARDATLSRQREADARGG
jgi:hypothetical protein